MYSYFHGEIRNISLAPDEGYPHIFLISPQEHILWELIRRAALRHF